MDKNLLAVSLFPVDIKGSISDPFESERNIEILTDNSVYRLADEVKIKVSFKNELSKDIKIVNDGCGVPFFILEKKVKDIWEEVYFPICYTLIPSFVRPTELKINEEYTSLITIYTNKLKVDNAVGEYRLYFDLIDKESNKRLPEKLIYSNVFKIVQEL
jgi:hypothetical protein